MGPPNPRPPAPLEIVYCRECRIQNPDHANYCGGCGRLLKAKVGGVNEKPQGFRPIPTPAPPPSRAFIRCCGGTCEKARQARLA
jgi:hypothetical protein